MPGFLPFVVQQLANRPLMIHPSKAAMIVAALSGRMNISDLEDSFGRNMDRETMRDMAREERERIASQPAREARVTQARGMDMNRYYPDGKLYNQVGRIGILDVQGTLTRTWGVGPYSGSTGYDGIQAQLLGMMGDSSVKAIWMDTNSGGGAVDGVFDTMELIYACNARNGGKPIYAMAADHAYSSAFLLASAADKLFVPATGGVGSVGVVMIHMDVTGALEEMGVKATVIRSGAQKFKGNQFEPLDDATLAHFQEQCDETRDMFATAVARNMKLSKKSVLGTEALDYMGSHAKAVGFVNEVMSEHQAWAELEKRVARL